MKHIILFLSLLICFPTFLMAQNADDFLTVSGKIIDNETRRPLIYVSVRLDDTNIATVSNSEGNFILKIPQNSGKTEILFSHVGYESQKLPLAYFQNSKNVVRMMPAFVALDEIEIRKGDATEYMEEVFEKIQTNYPQQANQMVGFYRESMKKNNAYVSVTEAVIDVYKSPYTRLTRDQARIYKARRSTDTERIDTIFVKYKGGVYTALELDLAKNYQDFFYDDFYLLYNFSFVGKTYSGGRAQYIISFAQKESIDEPLCYGRFYVDTETKAIAKAEFSMNIESNNELATAMFIQRRPPGMKARVTEATYQVQYTEADGKWYFEYSRALLSFRCRWEKKWFSSTYTIQSEMAITDRAEEGVSKFLAKERLRANDVIAERVVDFEDENFWGAYNIIEPEQSIENAINKLSRKLKRRTEE